MMVYVLSVISACIFLSGMMQPEWLNGQY